MRIPLYTIALLLIVSCTNTSKSTSEEVPAFKSETADTIIKPSIASTGNPKLLKTVEDIKQEYEYLASKIKNKGLDSTSFTYDCRGEKQGTVVYYFDNDALKMIKHTYSEYSHFSSTDSYFVKDNAVFFVYYNQVSWSFDSQGKGTSDTKDDITENRFYIIDNKAVKCLEKKFTIRSSDPENTRSHSVANKEIACSSIKPVLQKFELLAKYKSQETSIACLEE
jgi:hypothetical protein